MKTVILSLLVLLVVSQGEALRCFCGGVQHKFCPSPVETCSGSNNFCGKVMLTGVIFPYKQGCMSANDCRTYNTDASSSNCCKSDMCNR